MLKNWPGSLLMILSIGLLISLTEIGSILALFLLCVVFNIIACGNTIYGTLSNPVSRFLGEISYGIYLLHLAILFIVFRFIIGFENAASLTAIQYWFVIGACSIFLILFCRTTYYLIEAPSMKVVPRFTCWIERQLALNKKISLEI